MPKTLSLFIHAGIVLLFSLFAATSRAAALPPLPIDADNLSGMVEFDDYLALVTDEGSRLAILKRHGANWQLQQTSSLDNGSVELDLEALAYQAPFLYALGSHSAKRKKLKTDKNQKQNLKRLAQTSPEMERQRLFRLKLNQNADITKIQSLSLQQIIAEQKIVAPFISIPSKENGIDLEALAVDAKGRLLVGFRGPVLRGNWVPVLRLKLRSGNHFAVKKSKWLWLNLDGRGLRGMSPIKRTDGAHQGQLLLAGAVGDQALSYAVYYWDESNQLSGKDRNAQGLRLLCEIDSPQGKPEGIQFKRLNQGSVEFQILEDGVKGGNLHSQTCRF
ncbi:DUF3616 domain-containing protein [Thiomicrorhabdus sp. 6S3-12]|uniref:DUF3616 domain-containing protein n=1 Tax=Thiomicrorhabdus sp. 6S3-12 TaxID=2819681 RepID=UPI001AADF4E4|nr:DUF3616 domain-containing protein [Thiomicrorhabdus sp. 6S3-12]MBO1924731.1 DUF3616 domain-containing protein [Thiomicrorhabdus sp. 6S3-12]